MVQSSFLGRSCGSGLSRMGKIGCEEGCASEVRRGVVIKVGEVVLETGHVEGRGDEPH